MGKVKIPYYRVKGGRAYFEPAGKIKAMGFQARPLGEDGVTAWAEALRLNDDYQRQLRGEAPTVSAEKVYPINSVGWAWQRYRRTDAWKLKSKSTRDKDWDWSWQFIEPLFGDFSPSAIEIEHIEALRAGLLKDKGLHTAHRTIKVWRAFWRVMAAMGLCEANADPSKIIRNAAPKGRSQTWSEGEIARLAKRAWREGYRGLAALLAVAWDTQFAPIDCRTLTPAQRVTDKRGTFFDTARGKTGKAVIGTLTRRTVRVLDAYIASLAPLTLMEDAIIFRDVRGKPYTADALGDDFRAVRTLEFPKDQRVMLDIRRSGAVEALAGEATPGAMAAKMGNSIDRNKQLQETYLPKRTATVRLADEARKRGRKVLRENE